MHKPISLVLYFQEIRDGLNNARREFSQTAQQIASNPCPSVGGCVTTTTLVALLVVQLIILISYMMYRSVFYEISALKFYAGGRHQTGLYRLHKKLTQKSRINHFEVQL